MPEANLVDDFLATDSGSPTSEAPANADLGTESDQSAASSQDQASAQTPDSPDASAQENDAETALAELAKAEELDLNDPQQRSFAEKLFARDQKLREAQQGTGEDALAALEKSILGTDQVQDLQRPPQQENQQQRPQQSDGPPKFGDIGDKWGPQWQTEAYKDEMKAYGDVAKALEAGLEPDFRQVHAIKDAQFSRQLSQFVPYFDQMVQGRSEQIAQRIIEQHLGDVLPEIRGSVQDRRWNDARETVLSQIERIPEYKGVRDLLKPEAGSIKFHDSATGQTEEVPNTPMNRVLAANPEILQIEVQHRDPIKAAQLTYLARLKVATKILGKGKVDPQTAQTLVRAGKQQQQRSERERARQGLNAGQSATTRPGATPSSNLVDSFADQPGPQKFGSLFG